MTNIRYTSLINVAFYVTTLFMWALSADPPSAHSPSPDNPSFGSCVLNFTEYPFQPTGECIPHHQGKVKYLNTISTTLCCRDILNALTKALARNTLNKYNPGNIFLPQEQWWNCTDHFPNLTSVSPKSCGLTSMYNGSHACSSISLPSLIQQERPYYNQAVDRCSNFSPSFDDTCSKCTDAIMAAINDQMDKLSVNDDDHEQAVCAVAIVISVVATKINDRRWVDDFFRCLLALQIFDDGYIKLKSSAVKAVSAVVIAVLVLILIVLLIKNVTKGKKRPQRPPLQPREPTTMSGLYQFTKAEIESAINYYNEKKNLGRGSAGQVYKGVLPSGQVVAIKHIYKSNSTNSFQREVQGLSKVRHTNLACLLGCCIEGGDQYLVYEYCAAGNLAQHLLRKDTTLTWERRVKILRDCALALRYLHHHIDGCIVHRDIKLTNILLTENLDPKLSDFGLAKMLGMEESKVFTDVRGTIGYMDPEYMSNAKLTSASDVYSFGIVILQVLSGQKVIDLDLDATDQLTRKARDVCAGKRSPTDFEDPKLEGRFNWADFEALLNIGVLCASKSSEGRPLIEDVFEELEKAWKNTVAELRARREINSTATSISKSMEVLSP